MRVRTMYNRKPEDYTSVKIEGVHMTIPNMSYTIEQLFEMHMNNLQLPIEEYIPHFDELDIEAVAPDLQVGEDIIDWYNRLSDIDRQAVLDTIEAEHLTKREEDMDSIQSPHETVDKE